MIAIDAHIKMPPKAKGGIEKYPFSRMQIGDSFLCDAGTTQRNISATISRAGQRLAMKFESRVTGNRVRVWRTA